VSLPADDPARTKIAELKARNATRDEIMDAMSTYEVSVSILVKGLSPGHAKEIVSQLQNHMVETHLEPGLAAVSSVGEPVTQEWLDGPLFGGELNG
jgi:hypothetical protein